MHRSLSSQPHWNGEDSPGASVSGFQYFGSFENCGV